MAFDGLLVVNKPAHLTSRAAVDRAQRWFPRTKVGHTGTLDPLATGVLVLCLGQATRLAEYVQALPKTYRALIRLGATSDTDDADGAITPTAGARLPTGQALQEALQGFLGTISQVPPAHSAVHVDGRRAYLLARKGESVALQARPVTIHRIRLAAYRPPLALAYVDCSKGTYIRALARDLGSRLGCGGLIQGLRRTKVGGFELQHAVGLDATAEEARAKLRPMAEAVAALPNLTLVTAQLARLARGQQLLLEAPSLPAGEVAVLTAQGELAAVGLWEACTQMLSPTKVFLR